MRIRLICHADSMAKISAISFICSSNTGLEKLIKEAAKQEKGENFILLADFNEKTTRGLAPAYLNALIRYKDSTMRTSSLSLEMLLFLSGTMRISEAIRAAGARSNSEFILFATDRKIFSRFTGKNKISVKKKIELDLDPELAQEVAMTELLSEK